MDPDEWDDPGEPYRPTVEERAADLADINREIAAYKSLIDAQPKAFRLEGEEVWQYTREAEYDG